MRRLSQRKIALALFVAGTVAMSSVLADKSEEVGRGKSGKGKQESHHEGSRADDDQKNNNRDNRDDIRASYFDDHQRTAAREYYEDSYRSGRCPPGLAKKHNGCVPPGQAKKWSRGQPLQRDVIFYDLPPSVVIRMGSPPSGHKYVRVASDILLIAIGTGMVVDAIQDFGR